MNSFWSQHTKKEYSFVSQFPANKHWLHRTAQHFSNFQKHW